MPDWWQARDGTGADLTSADLADADLADAYLTNADLTSADLTSADLTSAELNYVIWVEATCPDGTNSSDHGNTCVGYGI